MSAGIGLSCAHAEAVATIMAASDIKADFGDAIRWCPFSFLGSEPVPSMMTDPSQDLY
jgi:hypothetical protein